MSIAGKAGKTVGKRKVKNKIEDAVDTATDAVLGNDDSARDRFEDSDNSDLKDRAKDRR